MLIRVLAFVPVLLLPAACGDASPEVQAQRKTTMEAMKEAMSKAGALLKMEKAELVQKLKGGVSDLETRAAPLTAKMATLGADAKARLGTALSKLEVHRAEFTEALKRLEASAPDEIEALKKKAAEAYNTMVQSFGAVEEAAGPVKVKRR